MDWTAAYEQVMKGSPVYIGAALLALAWVTRKSVLASIDRFGRRIGRLEQGRAADQQVAYLERVRLWQVVHALEREGLVLPPWPDQDVVPTPLKSRHSERSSLG